MTPSKRSGPLAEAFGTSDAGPAFCAGNSGEPCTAVQRSFLLSGMTGPLIATSNAKSHRPFASGRSK